MARAPGWASGALASGPLLAAGGTSPYPRFSGVPCLRQQGHRCGRRHSGGPTDEVLGKATTPRPSPHPPWRPATPAPGRHSRRGHPPPGPRFGTGAVARNQATPLHRRTQTPEYFRAAPAVHAESTRTPTSEYVRAAPRLPAPPSGFYVFSFTSGSLDPIRQARSVVSGGPEKGPAGPTKAQRLLGSPPTTTRCSRVEGEPNLT